MAHVWKWARSRAIGVTRRLSDAHGGENGQVIILFAPILLFFAAAGWLVVDVGTAFAARRDIQHTVDLMALAGTQELPGNPALAKAKAEAWGTRNGLTSPPYTISVVTDNTCGNSDPADNPAVIDSMSVTVTRPTDRYFANYFGVASATVGAKSKACWGEATVPLDLTIIIDRSGSMSSADLTNAKAAAKAVLALYDPAVQSVSLGVLGGSSTSSLCTGANAGGLGLAHASGGSWTPVGLSTNYKTGTALNNASLLVKTINCLNTSSVGTNLTQPVVAARTLLTTTGRPGVKKGIIFMTDGAANEPGANSCKQANDTAALAKAAGIEIFMVAFGIENEKCNSSSGENSSSPYYNQWVTKLMADMATTSLDDHNHCATLADQTAENADGDHFLCAPKTADLTPVFTQAAKAFAGITIVE